MRETYEHWQKAFTEPGLDYMFVYLKLALTLGLIVFAFWFFFGKKEEPGAMIGFDDIGLDAKVVNSEDEKKEAKSSAKKGDTKDKTTAQSTGQEVVEYRSMSLKKEID